MEKNKIYDNSTYSLKLFIAGNEPNSVKAKEIVQQICETYLRDKFNLDIIDVYEDYKAALDHKIMVVPALIVHSTQIKTTIVGSLNNPENLVKKLGLTFKHSSDE